MGISLYDRPATLEELEQSVPYLPFTPYEPAASPYEVVDDYYGNLAVVTQVVVYAGTITKMELEYDSIRQVIPASGVPVGKQGLVHVWVRNDTTTARQLGIWWEVRDPDGLVRETHAEWEMWPYSGAGVVHEFIGGRFPLDKTGTWSISIQAFMEAP